MNEVVGYAYDILEGHYYTKIIPMPLENKLWTWILFFSIMLLNCKYSIAQPHSWDSFYHKGGKLNFAGLEYVSSFYSEKDIEMYSTRIGYGFFLCDNLILYGSLDVSGTTGNRFVKTDNGRNLLNAESCGLGTSFLLRWHFGRIGHFRLFIDVGGGILYTFQSFPPEGTKLNFAVRPGGGVAVLVTKSLQLFGGVNRFHLSNGQGYNHIHNPALDGLGIFMGVVFRSK